MEVKRADGRGVRVREGERAQLAGEGAGLAGVADNRLDDERWALGGTFAEPDEGAAGGTGVGAEDLLTGLGVERAGGRLDALSFAAAEPEATGRIHIAAVAHA